MPRVSVVMPAFDCARTLAHAVRSALGQSVADLEVIIVDDGSRDDTLAVARTLANEDPRVRVLTQPNSGGPAAPRNRAIAESTGALVAFLDPDDWWRDDKLARQLAVLDAHPDVDLVFCDAELVDADGASLGATYLGRVQYRARAAEHLIAAGDDVFLSGDSFLAFSIAHVMGAQTSGVVIRRAALDALGTADWFPTDLAVGEDIDLYFRVMARGRTAFVDAPLHAYRQHAGSLMRDASRVVRGQVAAHTRGYRRWESILSSDDRARYRARIADLYFALGYSELRAGRAASARLAYRSANEWRTGTASAFDFAKTLLPRRLRAALRAHS